MRAWIVALALGCAGCAAFPNEVRIQIPQWMRGQPAAEPAPAASGAQGASSATAPGPVVMGVGGALPSGSLSSVYARWTSETPARFPAGTSAASVQSTLTREGFACIAQGAAGVRGPQAVSCERLNPIERGCEDVFVVTLREPSAGAGDVRRRCPVGVTPPL